jgi:RNA polymerase sigma-70 factor (ECF subfamily)
MPFSLLNNEPPHRLTDEELVGRFAKTKKQSYFEELYKRYRHLAYGVCIKMLKDDSESRDVVSEVFKILFVKLPGANVQSFKSYLYAVARNECIARLRQQKTETTKLADLKYMENTGQDFMENDGLLTLMDSGLSLDTAVEKAVEQLGEGQRICIRLFFYEDKSYRDISSETGYTEKQVKSYLQNGKRNLRIMLEDDMRNHIS